MDKTKMDKKYINEVCKIGQGHLTCRFLAFGIAGFTCLKLSKLASTLNTRVEAGAMNARGDNCEGLPE